MRSPLTVQSLAPMQQIVYKFARAVLWGEHAARQLDKIRAPSNLEVQRHLKFGTLFTELRIRRIKRPQEIVTHQRAHQQ
eukprot:8684845-Pyramimonas_sp.AAC.1